MKILVITDLYPINENEKYTPRTIKAFVENWKKSGHEVRVIKPNFIFNSFLRKKPFYKCGLYGEVENINYWLPFIGNIRKKVKTDLKADLVIAHMPSGIIFANKLGLNFSAAVHASDIEVLTNPLYGIYFKSELEKGYQNARKIACRSYVLRDKFLKIYPEFASKTFVAPSGISFKPVKREWKPKGKIKVLTCGQLIKRKNIDKVIRVCEKIPDIELTVIGSGAEFNNLREISAKPMFTGQLPHDKVLEKMRESDIFVLPSVRETFGMVYLEAMGSGCVTVCTKNDGIDGIIKDGENGFLTEPDGLEKVLEKILNSKELNKVLGNCYKTILDCTDTKTSEGYLSNLML